MRHLPTTVLTAIAFALATPLAASAQSSTYRAVEQTPRITGFDVKQVSELTPGTELNFTVWGTPGAQAALQIDAAGRAIVLVEVSPGVKGAYTISRRDRLVTDSRVSAKLRAGNRVGMSTLDENLQTEPQRVVADSPAAPQIDRFDARRAGSPRDGEQLVFALRGTPGGRAGVRRVGAQERFLLTEGRPGDYAGTRRCAPPTGST